MLDDLRLTLQQNIGAELTPELCARLYASMLFRPPTGIEPERFTPMEWGGFTFQAERISDVLGELHELHRLHWQETEGYRSGVMMNPDYEAMKDAESAGRMIQFTARREGAVVGNLRMYLSNSLHTQRLIATEDSLFVHPDHRVPWMAVAFLRYVIDCLRSIGVTEVNADVKLSNDAQQLLKRVMGKPVGLKFHKVL